MHIDVISSFNDVILKHSKISTIEITSKYCKNNNKHLMPCNRCLLENEVIDCIL